MIDLKELRERAEHDRRHEQPMGVNPSTILELIDLLEAAEQREQALSHECDEIAHERDSFRDAYNALAAHVEQAKRIGYSHVPGYAGSALDDHLSSAPTTNLARRKAQWQIEALQELLARIPGTLEISGCDCGQEAAQLIAKLRRQAEEGAS